MDEKRYIFEKKGLFRPGGFLMENSEHEMGHFGKKGHYVDFAEDVKKPHFEQKATFLTSQKGLF